MQKSEKLCLKWNDFHNYAIETFTKLRTELDFTDVTLACEGGQQIEAHKVVLYCSSPFFEDLLKNPHPLVYMRGLKFEDLTAILDFYLLGKQMFFKKILNIFLRLQRS